MSQNDHASPRRISSLKLLAMENRAKASAAEASQYRNNINGHGDDSTGRILSDISTGTSAGLAAFRSSSGSKSIGSGFNPVDEEVAQTGSQLLRPQSTQSGRSSRRMSMAEIKDRLNSQLSYNAGVRIEDKAKDQQLPDEDVKDFVSESTNDDEDFFTHRTWFEQLRDIVFSVLFFMVHGNKAAFLLEYGSLIIEDLQLFTFYISSDIIHIYTVPDNLSGTVINFDNLDLKGTYTNLLAVCAAAAYVAFGFVNGHHRFIWPIRTLRLIATVLPTVFYIPIFEVLVAALTCNLVSDDYHSSWESGDNVRLTLANTGCLDPNRWPLVAVASVALLLYIPVCIAVAGVFFDTNPTLKHVSNRVHGRVEITYIVLKTLLTCVYHFLGDAYYWPKLITATFVSIYMWGAMLYYFPYYNKSINQIRAGFYASSTCIGLASLVGALIHDIRGQKVGYEIFGSHVFLFVFAYIGGYYITGYVYDYIQERCEIAVRMLTKNMSHRSRAHNPQMIDFATDIFKRGIKEFPDQPFVRLSYALYLLAFHKNPAEVRFQLAKIRQLQPAMDVTFQLYFTDQLNNQSKESDFLGLGVKLDVANYAEFQKNDREAKLNHFLALQEMKMMWKLLLDKEYRHQDLSDISVRLYSHAQKAQDNYIKLLAKYPRSRVIMRYFARFCYDVTCDVARGDALTEKADELELETMPLCASTHTRSMVASEAEEDDENPNGQGNRSPELKGVLTVRSKLSGSEAASSVESGTSSSGKRSQNAAKRLRISLLEKKAFQLKMLLSTSNLIVLVMIIANFTILTTLLSSTGNELDYLINLHTRERLTSTEFRRIRQIQRAYERGDYASVIETQHKLQEEMLNFTEAAKTLYKTRNVHDTVSENYYTQPEIFVIISFLGVTDYTIRRFRDNQRHFLEIFRKIPKEIIREVLEDLEEIDNSEIFPPSILKISESMSSRTTHGWLKNNFRAQQAFYSLVLISFAILDQSGDMQTFSIRCLELLKEMVDFDQQTWNTTDDLNANYLYTADQLSGIFDAIIFGDPTRYPASPSYNNYNPKLQDLMENLDCTPYNQSVCLPGNTQWNSTIGFDANAVTLGLLHLTTLYMDEVRSYETISLNGPFVPTQSDIAFMESVVEPYFVDGWHRIEEEVRFEAATYLTSSVRDNILIFIAEIILVLFGYFGQFYSVRKMMANFKFTDQCIYDILLRLPSEVKKLPEIAAMLDNNMTYGTGGLFGNVFSGLASKIQGLLVHRPTNDTIDAVILQKDSKRMVNFRSQSSLKKGGASNSKSLLSLPADDSMEKGKKSLGNSTIDKTADFQDSSIPNGEAISIDVIQNESH
ncbi:hypothetical protein HDU76_000514 [Blyttiomyces sp. JEL0837]|nr:hypothetical protein HDU76_000514 [Blyttiomyces sp. JEL0837]